MHIFSVRAAGHTTEGQDGAVRKTLGDLLYTDGDRVYAREEDWVKLIQSIAAGEQVALHSLYEQTHRLVFTLILRITNNPGTAEELTVDVFHEVWRRAPAYDPAAGPVVGWIMNQARSRAIDRVRYEHRKKRTNPFADKPLVPVAPNDPEQACEIQEQNRIVRNALTVLTPEERQAIETAFFSELTYVEAAAKLNQPLGTVKTRIRSGLGKLRQVLGATLKKAI